MVYENPDGIRIGLEIHVQLNKLKTKMFCGCSTDYHNAAPNTHTCPICLGLPGTLPVLNIKVVEAAIKVGLALEGEIAEETQFHRKNYFYPDLPKGFQVTQYDFPIVSKGKIVIEGEDGEHVVGITRAHMEEDPGKLVHLGSIEKSKGVLIDYNRSGITLIETVTEPDMRSPKEARRFLDKFRNILEYLDVFDGNLEGAMRVDANVSVYWGTRVEVKNISSHKGVERALLYEIMRQKNVIRRGGKISQETRHFDEGRGVTISLRTKEEAEDYRYFREPDLMPMRVVDWIPAIRETLPELPDAKRARFIEQYGITDMHARALTSKIMLADFYESICAQGVDPRIAATWTADVLLGELNYRDLAISSFDGERIGFVNNKDPSITNSFKVADMVELISLFAKGKISDRSAVEIIRTILYSKEMKYSHPDIMMEDFHRRVIEKVRDPSDASFIVNVVKTVLKNLDIQLHANVEGTFIGAYRKDPRKTVIIKDEYIAEIIEMLIKHEISEVGAVSIVQTYIESKKYSEKSPEEIAEEKGLFKAESDLVTKAVAETIAENEAAVQDYLSGTEKSLNFLVGQVMKKTKGTADAKTARELIVKKLKG